MSSRPAMGSFAIAWPGDSAEHVCRKWHTCSAEAECDLSVELTTRMAHGGHCEQDFRKDGVDRHLDRPSPVIPQPFLHLQNFVERQKRLWSEFNPLEYPDNRIFKIKQGALRPNFRNLLVKTFPRLSTGGGAKIGIPRNRHRGYGLNGSFWNVSEAR